MLHIVHATDFARASHASFVHALAIALVHEARLTLTHIGAPNDPPPDWSRFPGVRPQLAAWGLLAADAGKAEVQSKLGIRVAKRALPGTDPVEAIIGALDSDPADLLIVGRGAGGAFWPFNRRSVAGTLARRAPVPMLIIPDETRGFVSAQDGTLSLRSVLCAVDAEPDPRPSILKAAALLGDMACDGARVELFHVGRREPEHSVTEADLPGADLSVHAFPGDPATEIIARMGEVEADLLVLATEGRRGLVDMLYGSVTEQVLRATRIPVMAIPAR